MTHQDFLNLSDIHRTDLDLSLIILDSLMVDFDFESVNFNADKIIQNDSEQENVKIIYKDYVNKCLSHNKGYIKDFRSRKSEYELTFDKFYKAVFLRKNLSLFNDLYYDSSLFGIKPRIYYRHYVSPYIYPKRIEYNFKGYKMTIHRNQWSNFYTIRIIPSKSRYNKNKWQWSVTYDWCKNVTNGDESNYYKIDNEYYHHGYFLFPCQTLDKTIKIAKYFIHHFKTLKNAKPKQSDTDTNL